RPGRGARGVAAEEAGEMGLPGLRRAAAADLVRRGPHDAPDHGAGRQEAGPVRTAHDPIALPFAPRPSRGVFFAPGFGVATVARPAESLFPPDLPGLPGVFPAARDN